MICHSVNSIHQINSYDGKHGGSNTYIPVVVVGAGLSGICAGVKLKKELGIDQFRIYDRQSGIGGTWWINRYPGVACDVPVSFYSYSFAQKPDWVSFYPSGREISQYIYDVCEKFQIFDKIQVNADVTQCRWIEEKKLWEIEISHLVRGKGDLCYSDRRKLVAEQGESALVLYKESVYAKVLLVAAGGLTEPQERPPIPGFDTFQGSVFHSARWDDTVDIAGKNVIVIGAGCSAIQLIPGLIRQNAKKITQLMRTPPWVVERIPPPGGREWWSVNGPRLLTNIPGLMRLTRLCVFLASESNWVMFKQGWLARAERWRLRTAALKHIRQVAPSKYHNILTPDYEICCKRRVFDDGNWFGSLHDSRMELTTQVIESVDGDGVRLGRGLHYGGPGKTEEELREMAKPRHIPADIIILANGFQTQNWHMPLTIMGQDGRQLHEVWKERGGPQAYNGTAIDGFPNMFFIFGPNSGTGHSSVIFASENMTNYSLPFVKMLLAGDAEMVDVKEVAEREYTAAIQNSLRTSVWNQGGCTNWYRQKDWNGVGYPFSQLYFVFRSHFHIWSDWNIKLTSQGVRRKRRQQLGRMALSVACAGIVLAAQSFCSPEGLAMHSFVLSGLHSVTRTIGAVKSSLSSLVAASI